MNAQADATAHQFDAFDKLITFRDPSKPDVSTHFKTMVKVGLRTIPLTLWQPLIGYGTRVLLVPDVASLSDHPNEQPRGYEAGSSYHHVKALYMPSRNCIVVGGYYLQGGKKTVNEDPDECICHELGHAYDSYLGAQSHALGQTETYSHFSHSQAFEKAYSQDAAKINGDNKKQLEYFLQTGRAGQEELFAELFPTLFRKGLHPYTRDDLIVKSFPTVLGLIKRVRDLDPEYIRSRDLYESHVKNFAH